MRIRLALLFCGSFLLFISIWKGDGGYTDLREYIDDAERLWTRFDMAVPNETVEEELKEGQDLQNLGNAKLLLDEDFQPFGFISRPRYNRYAIGLALISAPMVFIGDDLEYWTGRVGLRRQIITLLIPLLAALTVVFIFLLGRELGFHPRVCFWTSFIFAFGSPFLTYSRLFFTEVPISFFIVLAIFSFLCSRRNHTSTWATLSWLMLCGGALAGIVLCHYGNVCITAILWMAFSSAILYPLSLTILAMNPSDPNLLEKIPAHHRLIPSSLRVLALTLGPALALAGLLWLNKTRYGHPLDTGYYKFDVENQIGTEFISYNLKYAGLWLWRTPWLLFAIFWGRKLFPRQPALAVGLLLALVVQDFFWMNYQLLGYFPQRYQQSLIVLCVPGLFFLGETLLKRFPKQGLWYTGLFILTLNLHSVFSGDDSKSKPFLQHPQTQEWLSYVWYMKPFPPDTIDGYGTPLSSFQLTLFALLVVSGAGMIYLSTYGYHERVRRAK